jgi:hypothetical protein
VVGVSDRIDERHARLTGFISEIFILLGYFRSDIAAHPGSVWHAPGFRFLTILERKPNRKVPGRQFYRTEEAEFRQVLNGVDAADIILVPLDQGDLAADDFFY